MQLTNWQPLREMDEMVRKAAHRFDDRASVAVDADGFNVARWTPSADISETKKEFLIKADLPDVDKKDIAVTVQDGSITIEGERRCKKEDKGETFHRIESLYGKFTRTFALPSNVDASKVRADAKNGVLNVHIPKVKNESKKSKTKIDVK